MILSVMLVCDFRITRIPLVTASEAGRAQHRIPRPAVEGTVVFGGSKG